MKRDSYNSLRFWLGLTLVTLLQLPIITQEVHLVSDHHEEHHCTDPTRHFHEDPDHLDCWLCHINFSHFNASLYFPTVPVDSQYSANLLPVCSVSPQSTHFMLEPSRGPPVLLV